MSTIAYALFTTAREKAIPNTSTRESPPGIGTYVDALAALVPAEVLTLHAVILSVTTKTENATTQIIAGGTLFWAFIGLMVLSVALFVIPRLRTGKWDSLDYVRATIPPLAFVCWTMLQRATAFDAVCVSLAEAPRTVIALFLGVSLGILAVNLAYKADQKQT